MLKICEVCGNEFEAKRTDSRCCSPKCRKALSRLSVTEGQEIVTDNHLSVTPDLRVVTDNRDDIFSPDYDISLTGFARRNLNWSDFKPKFRADTITACIKINRGNLAEISAQAARRAKALNQWEGVSAVRGQG